MEQVDPNDALNRRIRELQAAEQERRKAVAKARQEWDLGLPARRRAWREAGLGTARLFGIAFWSFLLAQVAFALGSWLLTWLIARSAPPV